jgi:hypothetical protein
MTTFSISLLESKILETNDEISGTDSEDRIYSSIKELWDFELGTGDFTVTPSLDWYGTAYDYWENESEKVCINQLFS